MHYRNGRKARNGDAVVSLAGYGLKPIDAVGILRDATPGNDYCNGKIVPFSSDATGKVDGWTLACLCDCLHMDDVFAILKEKGLDKRPPGK
jgi:hypothetical protein